MKQSSAYAILFMCVCIFAPLVIYVYTRSSARPHSAIGRAPDSQGRGPGFNTQSGHILSFLLALIQEGQLSVTGKSMCMKCWLTA